jgi:GntR family transcriptional repressor for pyruvate dehydrogenase complex
MAPPRYEEVVRTSAAEEVHRRLVELVEKGELAVGEKLASEVELAQSFGVSRPVVREALGALRAAGIVRSRTGHGTFIASRRPNGLMLLGRHSYDELHEVRCNLEIPGAGHAAQRRLPEQVERLGILIAQLEATSDPVAWVDLDAAFHVCLAEATQNGVQVRLVENFRGLLTEQSLVAAEVPGRREQANREHRGIYVAVTAGNAGEAERAMKQHLDSTHRSLQDRVDVRR